MKNTTTGNQPLCYAIPGLGVTGEVFSRLEEYIGIQVIDWILPHEKESLARYTERISLNIPQEASILLGYSFGGIVAQEIQKLRPNMKLILINTLVNSSEKPLWLKVMKYLPLYRLARGRWRITLLPVYGRRYGLKSRSDISILQKMFGESPDSLRMWSIRALTSWNGSIPEKGTYFRLHGTKDKVFPLNKLNESGIWIQEGRHFMVWQQAKEVAAAINKWIAKG